MLGRKTYTPEELANARAAIDQQLATYDALASAVDRTEGAGDVLRAFETRFANNMLLVLDRYFVHRVRLVTGKDGNALNEVEMYADALMNNEGVLEASTVIKLKPSDSVLKIEFGDRIELTVADFERLSSAFLAEIEARFVS